MPVFSLGCEEQHSSELGTESIVPKGWKCTPEFSGRNAFFLCDPKLKYRRRERISPHDLKVTGHFQVNDEIFFTFQLIKKLKLILLETPSCDLGDRMVAQHQGSILRLQELLSQKVDVATELLLRVRVVFLLQY